MSAALQHEQLAGEDLDGTPWADPADVLEVPPPLPPQRHWRRVVGRFVEVRLGYVGREAAMAAAARELAPAANVVQLPQLAQVEAPAAPSPAPVLRLVHSAPLQPRAEQPPPAAMAAAAHETAQPRPSATRQPRLRGRPAGKGGLPAQLTLFDLPQGPRGPVGGGR